MKHQLLSEWNLNQPCRFYEAKFMRRESFLSTWNLLDRETKFGPFSFFFSLANPTGPMELWTHLAERNFLEAQNSVKFLVYRSRVVWFDRRRIKISFQTRSAWFRMRWFHFSVIELAFFVFDVVRGFCWYWPCKSGICRLHSMRKL